MTNDRRRILVTLAAAGLAASGVTRLALADESVIDIVAKKFEFVPADIAVRRGQPVTLRFTAPEVPMGVNLADFSQRVDIVPGQVATLRFTPDKVGTFTFVCDLFCGSGHEDMSGTLTVS